MLCVELMASEGADISWLVAVGGDGLRKSEVCVAPLMVFLAFAGDDVRATGLIGGVEDGAFVAVSFKRKFKFMVVKLGTLVYLETLITKDVLLHNIPSTDIKYLGARER